MNGIAIIETRSQSPAGVFPAQGPDTYVAVQIIPPYVPALKCLREDLAERRGIKIKYFGDGYSRHSGPKSKLGKALRKAEKFSERFQNAYIRRGVNGDLERTGK